MALHRRPTIRRMMRRLLLPAAAVLSLVTAVAACGSDDETGTDTTSPGPDSAAAEGSEGSAAGIEAAGACAPASLPTLTEGTLTFATSEPAYEPWMVDNDPTSGEGYEAAVAAAVAERLGYPQDLVEWVRVPFDVAIAPGPKDFDVAINQFSITDERREAVDFTSSYYDVRQTVISVEGNAGATATSLAELKDIRLGAQVGTTSLAAIAEFVAPTTEAAAFNTNDDAKLALDSGQVDAIVVDLPTAFYLTGVEIEGGVIVGQLPQSGGTPEQFGMVLDLDSPLTDCVSGAVDALREDGTLTALEAEWLAAVAGAPELS